MAVSSSRPSTRRVRPAGRARRLLAVDPRAPGPADRRAGRRDLLARACPGRTDGARRGRGARGQPVPDRRVRRSSARARSSSCRSTAGGSSSWRPWPPASHRRAGGPGRRRPRGCQCSDNGPSPTTSWWTDSTTTTGSSVARVAISARMRSREFQVLTSSYPAEFGNATGGVVNIVTRSGSNAVHGTAFRVRPRHRAERPRPLRAVDPFGTPIDYPKATFRAVAVRRVLRRARCVATAPSCSWRREDADLGQQHRDHRRRRPPRR